MTDQELREVLSNLTGYPSDSRTVQAFEHVCREFAAAKLREVAADVDLCCERIVRGRGEAIGGAA